MFDYLGMPVRFGSNLDRDTGAGLIEDINAVLPHPLPKTLSGDTLAEARDQAAADQQAEPESQPSAMVAPTATPAGRTSLWLPLGVLLLDWSVGDIMLLFWLKSAIVGFFQYPEDVPDCRPHGDFLQPVHHRAFRCLYGGPPDVHFQPVY